MAPKPGADSLLAPKPKAASAGIIPALAVAALLALAGCGGDSDTSAQSAASPQGGAEAPKGQAKATSPSPGEGNKQTKPSNPPSNQGTPSAKQGPPITLPKGQPERAPSAAEKANSALASIALQSPDLPATSSSEAKLPATFTCAGKDSWPTLKWSGVPAGSAELVLFVLGLEPVNEALFFNWAVAGLDPSLEGIEAAKLPKG